MGKYEIFDRLGLDFKPVGVKFSMFRPKDLPLLDKKVAVCEMLHVAQTEGGFYAAKECHGCAVGPYVLGESEDDPGMVGGLIGPRINVYEDPRANANIYYNMKTLAKGTCPYIMFDTTDHMTFDPDLVILMCHPSQAEIVLRANGYRTGRGWHAVGTTVAGCACLYTWPYLTGELNMMVTGLHHGMKARKIFPEGLLMLSLPYQVLPEIIDSLEKMEWDLPQYSWGKEYHTKYMAGIGKQIAEDLSE